MADKIKIADLRSTLVLSSKTSVPSDDGGVQIIQTNITSVRAKVFPTKDAEFIGDEQLDIDVSQPTHIAIIRWREHSNIFDTAYRDTTYPSGETRHEEFRVIGVADFDNQRRFMKITMQLMIAKAS